SMKAPLARRKRRVGSTEAATAGVTVGLKYPFKDCVASALSDAPATGGCVPMYPTISGPGAAMVGGGIASSFELRAKAGPARRRGEGRWRGGWGRGRGAGGGGGPRRDTTPAGGNGGAGPRILSIALGSGCGGGAGEGGASLCR